MSHLSSIRKKLQASFSAIILFSVFCSGLSYYYLHKSGNYQEVEEQITMLNLLLQEARKAEKDFMLYDRKQPEFLETGRVESTLKHNQLADSIRQLIRELQSNDVIADVGAQPILLSIGISVHAYERSFQEFVEKMYRRGFRDHGLEVQMRNYVHELQEAPSAEEREIAFMMRRHEKDFIMRNDLKYVDQIHEKARRLHRLLQDGSLPHIDEAYKKKAANLLTNYIAEFDKLVQFEKELGLTDNTGLRGELKARAEEVEPQVAAVRELIGESVEQLQFTALLAVVGFMVFLLLVGVSLAILLANIISKPLILLDEVIQDVLKGNYESGGKLKKIIRDDELDRLASNFNLMLDRQHEHMRQIEEKNQRLEAAAVEDAKRQWTVEGLNKFGDMMKQKASLQETCQLVLSELVKYTKSNQGGLFLLNEDTGDETLMELAACYAFDRRKFIDKKVQPGEGLLGTAWLEKDTIYITDVPQDCINITSGLGGANPGCILIVRLISEDKVEGIIELASFNPFEAHQINFVQELANRLASVIEGLNMQEKTNSLLKESRTLAEEKQVQEQELRHQMEELQRLQEEMLQKRKPAYAEPRPELILTSNN